MERRGLKALVTGGTGFVGGALARRLHAEGARVTALGRNRAAGAALEREGIAFVAADLADAQAVDAACRGQDWVFHSGALAAPWGPYEEFYAANVTGTENVVAGCRQGSVRRLVHVSTPSVYFADQPRRDVAEGDPLPARHLSDYAATKLLAEQVVARAHQAGLPVITIRPRAIIGPGDTALLPRLIRPLRRGILPVIGDGQNLADLTCVENVVDALLLCAEAPDALLGRTFNITNGEPMKLWDMVRTLCGLLGFPPPRWRLSLPAALRLAGAIERVYAIVLPNREPPLTRFAVRGVALDATLDITAARRDLGYAPRVSVDEGLRAFAGWWKAAHP
jgi:nucleoside-diphosphate-sugar epimerase